MNESKNPSSEPDNTSNPPAKKKNTAVIIIVSALAVLLLVALYFIYDRNTKLDERSMELKSTYERLDSISDQLDAKITEIERLGGDITELEEAKVELEQEKEQLWKSKRYTERQLAEFKERLNGYKELLLMKDEEIENLKKVNEVLVSENTELKTEKNELVQNLNQAKVVQDELVDKVNLASKLEAENIVVAAVNRRGKERAEEFRSRQIEKLKVTFNIARNDVAPIEGKEILLRIIDDNGEVLFDVAKGSGTFLLNDEETFFTEKQEILFDNTEQEVTFIYDKGSEYERGVYTAEIYTDGYMMGRSQFTVK
jgi:regulator of replication initiation timing